MAKARKRKRKTAAAPRRHIAGSGCITRLAPRQALDLKSCEQFLLREARLLDEGKFDDWLALFTPEAWYWVPIEPDQADRFETVSLINDDRRLLETRVRRLASPRMYSPGTALSTSRIVANVTIEEAATQCLHRALQIHDDRIPARAAASVRRHCAARPGAAGSGIMIAWKRVDLVDCDAPLDGITIPF